MEHRASGPLGPFTNEGVFMRRVIVAAVVCAAVLLLAAPAFAGMARQATTNKPIPAPHVPRKATPVLRSFAPLGARLAVATASVSGTVIDSSGYTLAGVPMEWWSQVSDTSWSSGKMTTGSNGGYSATTRATTNGEIWAQPDDDTTWARTGQSWAASGSYPGTDVSPGRVNVSASRDGVWNKFGELGLTMWGDSVYSYDRQATANTSTSPATMQSEVMSGQYSVGSVNFWLDEGVEFTTSLTVNPGATPSGTIFVREDGAQRIEIPGYKYSGKPGATISVNRYNFPAGWRNHVSGYSDPSGKPSANYGIKKSNGGARESVNVKIPGTAKPGYSYYIGFQHVLADNTVQPLYVETSYQVCTMKPSKTKIGKSTKIRVTGIVPTEGHWGNKLGKRKKVLAIWHKGSATPATKKGWYLLASTKCKGNGAYTSPYFRVPATGTLAVYYYGDDWYWSGFTSTAKITVK
jgi:hypothetical protein